ncbi:Tetratricopeptide TPR_2 repeat-containing protein [Crinalium epipsammum PCC 9333]|uniref:protein O-GlcNAc transferase n=1 Tax=Crinalium epipsammum PCC 9333 TaxID=1173022 RepID=K9W1G5_9CYAN|nr:tetratricopeptide repeat protein [Crinalium epipsammum]AFZ14218.1 Tetratricopeptide TPR_2 repeat-containing protein [Crinalium epipsammum PCC 9333]
MDYQKFIKKLPQLYEGWGKASAQPLTEIYNEINHQIGANSSTSIMQLLNWGLQCMSEEEVFCQIDGITASDVIGALINHPQIAYLVAQPTDNHQQSEVLFELTSAVSLYNLDEQIILTEQPAAEFFGELRQISPETKIGVYVYAGAHDYRSQLLALQLVKPLLAPQALIIAFGSKYSTAQQAHWDFLTTTPQAQLLLELPATVQNTWGEGIQIFSWDIEQDYSYDGSDLTENHRSQIVIEALRNTCEQLELQTLPQRLLNLEQQALQLEINQQFIPAVEIYQQIIQLQPNHADAYYHLGIINAQMQRYSQAHEMLLRSISIDDTRATYHYSLGLVSQQLGLVGQAIEAYEATINLDTQCVDAYNNLGNLLCELSNIQQAELVYRNAIANVPSHFGSYLNLGNLLMEQQQVDEAIAFYEASLEFHSDNQDILHNLKLAKDIKNNSVNAAIYLGDEAHKQGKYSEAIAHYEKALSKPVEDVVFYTKLADCYQKNNQPEVAINSYKKGIKYHPTATYLYLSLITYLQQLGRVEEAIAFANEAAQLLPKDFAIQLEKCRILPILYQDAAEIDFYRRRFIKQLFDFISQLSLVSTEAKNNALKGLSWRTNFYLHYQSKNDLDVQIKYGQLVHQVMAANYPQWVQPIAKSQLTPARKIRVGYISYCMQSHTVGHLFLGWLKNHNRQNLEIYSYYNDSSVDWMTQQFRLYSDVFCQITECHIPKNLEKLCRQIINDKLDILVFIDIGMHPALTQIGALRLAPIQCVTWGHPITSGLPNIDYFLSSNLMEPPNNEKHYSEKLIRLPNIGINYAKPVIPELSKKRCDFYLREDATIYLSCQSIYKYLPQYDYIYAAIAQRITQAQFVFLSSGKTETIDEKFRQRLQKAFASFGLNSAEYCVILPRINRVDYLNLNLVADIYLDTFGWSGGNTTLEAIACNLPIVTCPGEFMRGRHSYGILRMLGVIDTIATDEAEYIEIAVRLGLDQEWRESIINKVKQNQDRVYEDKTCVVALEEFYQRVVQEHLASK